MSDNALLISPGRASDVYLPRLMVRTALPTGPHVNSRSFPVCSSEDTSRSLSIDAEPFRESVTAGRSRSPCDTHAARASPDRLGPVLRQRCFPILHDHQ